MRFGWLLVVFFAFFAITGEARAASLLTNGSFESPGFTPAPAYRYMSNGDTSIAGWTVRTDGVGEAPYWMRSDGYGVLDGTYAYALNDGTSIETTFATSLGQAYRLTFHTTGIGTMGANGLVIEIAGFSRAFVSGDGVAIGNGWLRHTYDFVAPSTSPSALLKASNGPDGLQFGLTALDAFSVDVPDVVPEPASLTLGGALAALAVLRRIRRRRA